VSPNIELPIRSKQGENLKRLAAMPGCGELSAHAAPGAGADGA